MLHHEIVQISKLWDIIQTEHEYAASTHYITKKEIFYTNLQYFEKQNFVLRQKYFAVYF